MVKMVGFLIPDNPASSICRIPDWILNSTVLRNHVSGLAPWLTCAELDSDSKIRQIELGMSSAIGPTSVFYNL